MATCRPHWLKRTPTLEASLERCSRHTRSIAPAVCQSRFTRWVGEIPSRASARESARIIARGRWRMGGLGPGEGDGWSSPPGARRWIRERSAAGPLRLPRARGVRSVGALFARGPLGTFRRRSAGGALRCCFTACGSARWVGVRAGLGLGWHRVRLSGMLRLGRVRSRRAVRFVLLRAVAGGIHEQVRVALDQRAGGASEVGASGGHGER